MHTTMVHRNPQVIYVFMCLLRSIFSKCNIRLTAAFTNMTRLPNIVKTAYSKGLIFPWNTDRCFHTTL